MRILRVDGLWCRLDYSSLTSNQMLLEFLPRKQLSKRFRSTRYVCGARTLTGKRSRLSSHDQISTCRRVLILTHISEVPTRRSYATRAKARINNIALARKASQHRLVILLWVIPILGLAPTKRGKESYCMRIGSVPGMVDVDPPRVGRISGQSCLDQWPVSCFKVIIRESETSTYTGFFTMSFCTVFSNSKHGTYASVEHACLACGRIAPIWTRTCILEGQIMMALIDKPLPSVVSK